MSAVVVKSLCRSLVPAHVWAKLFKLRHEVWGGWRQREHVAGLLEKLGQPQAPLGGPFRGMQYLRESTGSAYFPKLLGTYELEIHSAIDWVSNWSPDLIVNVGCAEGYYAVGMAIRCPRARSIAFDIESRARRLVRKLAQLNHVEHRMQIRRKCTPDNLEPLCAGASRPCVIVDCEGFEKVLLDPKRVPSLRRSVMLVEVHDCFVPGLSALMQARFGRTHSVIVYRPRARTLTDLPIGTGLSPSESLELMDEGRGESCWMLIIPSAIALEVPDDRSPRKAA